MLTRKDNTWNLDRINAYLAVLDKIEKSEGPGVMITIGTGPKLFSSGFDLGFWAESYPNMRNSIVRFQEIMARLLGFPMPTVCVFNGSAIAGGYFLGLCHDYRIMHETKGNICLSELKLGLALPYPFTKVLQAKIDPGVLTRLAFGITVMTEEALKDRLIDSTYTTTESLES